MPKLRGLLDRLRRRRLSIGHERDGIIDDVRMTLRRVVCPAGEEIGDLRGSRLPNTPAVRCRVTHDNVSPDGSPGVLVKWCCNAEGGYIDCPAWRYDKDRIAAGQKSFGDEAEAKAQDERTWRDDLTGSEHGDVSWMDPIDAAVEENIEEIKRTGGFKGGQGLEVEP